MLWKGRTDSGLFSATSFGGMGIDEISAKTVVCAQNTLVPNTRMFAFRKTASFPGFDYDSTGPTADTIISTAKTIDTNFDDDTIYKNIREALLYVSAGNPTGFKQSTDYAAMAVATLTAATLTTTTGTFIATARLENDCRRASFEIDMLAVASVVHKLTIQYVKGTII
jgi:hypothetical protein